MEKKTYIGFIIKDNRYLPTNTNRLIISTFCELEISCINLFKINNSLSDSEFNAQFKCIPVKISITEI